MISSHSRGHKIIFIHGKWVYSDTKESISNERPCIKCNKMPTVEGYDACIGFMSGVISACCGHGKTNNKILIKGGRNDQCKNN